MLQIIHQARQRKCPEVTALLGDDCRANDTAIYAGILGRIKQRVRALIVGLDDKELERRALTVLLLFEGLQTLSAVRPELLKRNGTFRQHLIDLANAIIRAE